MGLKCVPPELLVPFRAFSRLFEVVDNFAIIRKVFKNRFPAFKMVEILGNALICESDAVRHCSQDLRVIASA